MSLSFPIFGNPFFPAFFLSLSIFVATLRLHFHQNFLLPKDQQWRSANGLGLFFGARESPQNQNIPPSFWCLYNKFARWTKRCVVYVLCNIHLTCMCIYIYIYISKKNSNNIQRVLAKTSRLHVQVNKFKTFIGRSNSSHWRFSVHAPPG